MKKRRIIQILLLLLAFNITPQIYAEIVSNDIVSIKYIEGTTSYYLAANEDALVIKNIPDEGCLWKIEKVRFPCCRIDGARRGAAVARAKDVCTNYGIFSWIKEFPLSNQNIPPVCRVRVGCKGMGNPDNFLLSRSLP